MRTRTTLAAAAVLAAGALLGWLAASERFRGHAPAGPSAVAAPVQPTKDEDRRDQPARDSKQPNIVFLLMDNLEYRLQRWANLINPIGFAD
jgi:hypothetical protein